MNQICPDFFFEPSLPTGSKNIIVDVDTGEDFPISQTNNSETLSITIKDKTNKYLPVPSI